MKAILVLDMPESCSKCMLNSNNNGRPDCCRVLWKPIVYIGKQDNCPLKEIPEKLEVGKSSFLCSERCYEYEYGYNSCLEDILGE